MIGRLRVAWITFALAVVTLVLLPAQLLAMPFAGPARAILPRLWHRCAVFLLGIRVETEGEPAGRGPLLLAVNHQSWLDILVLGSVMNASFVAKSDVQGWPIFGILARLHRTIFIDRERRRDVHGQVERIARRLEEGETLILFAEGTTSDGNRVLPFKSALFAAAQAALRLSGREEILVQPACLAYTRHQGVPMGRVGRAKVAWIGDQTLGPHLLSIMRDGAFDARIVFGQAVRFTPDGDRKALARGCERSVARGLVHALHPRD